MRLVLLAIRTKCLLLLEFFRVAWRYYPVKQFWKIDLRFMFRYFLRNPYRISRKFLQRQGAEQIYAYGETPLTTMDLIASKCQIEATDRVVELGCGRARACLWLAAMIGCEVVGIEWIESFVRRSQGLHPKVSLKCENFFESDLSPFSVVYLYGTCMSDEEVAALQEKLSGLKKGTKIITVSFPLKGELFKVEQVFPGWFVWGWTNIYLHTVR